MFKYSKIDVPYTARKFSSPEAYPLAKGLSY